MSAIGSLSKYLVKHAIEDDSVKEIVQDRGVARTLNTFRDDKKFAELLDAAGSASQANGGKHRRMRSALHEALCEAARRLKKQGKTDLPLKEVALS